MKKTEEGFKLSPSDLSNHLGCAHLTQLNLAAVEGKVQKPKWLDPSLAVMQERGLQFEKDYLDYLRKKGFSIAVPGTDNIDRGFERTLSEMRKGVDYIYQAWLENDDWIGTADFLKRTETPSKLGGWSYEVEDTKLASETKAGAILQLCLYSQVVEQIQGLLPEFMHIVTPDDNNFIDTPFRTQDYIAYHRLMQRRLKDQLAQRPDLYPDPVAHCDICRWWQVCDKRRRVDDHLSLVAGISNLQRVELKDWGIHTLEALSKVPLPIPHKPNRGSIETYSRIREQARVQFEGRVREKPVYELLDLQAGFGLYKLPEPSPGDIFLDFEGDPFVGSSGLEYLTGWVEVESGSPEYHHIWAFEPAGEKIAFESFLDRVIHKLEKYPNLHIYHFGHYEPSALKRLMGRYATKEYEIDRLLRGKRFVDLHSILKHTLRASVEKYSLKDLEKYFKFQRETDLREASLHKRNLEHALELSRHAEILEENKEITLAYNREDCLSAYALRNWLEQIRTEQLNKGVEIGRPELSSGDASESLEERTKELQLLYDQLIDGIPPDTDARSPEQQAKWLLANLLEFHRREAKAKWWEYFRLKDLSQEELVDEKSALGKLRFERRVVEEAKYVIDQYSFPPQECDLSDGDVLEDLEGEKPGSISRIESGFVEIRKSDKYRTYHPTSVFTNKIINDKEKREALFRLGQWVTENGMEGNGPFPAGRSLLLRNAPSPGRKTLAPSESLLETAKEWTRTLNNSFLPIQGPPGAGKTYTGARIIIDLVKQGKKVGITALGHKVMRNLLEEVIKAAKEEGIDVRCAHKPGKKSADPNPDILEETDNAKALALLKNNKVNVLAGTTWMWPRHEFIDSVDVLVVDEAGQLSLADTIAASQATKSMILLGDPQQLKQPQQGTHPEGTEVSALEHILQGENTIADDKGLFLNDTWRMHPKICKYISEMFYTGRLHPHEGMELQVIEGNTSIKAAGLWYLPLNHHGNQNSSTEEAETVHSMITDLTKGDVFWTNHKGEKHIIQQKDILVISPYNAQVAKIKSILPDAIRVGTVDKFQGQEAPIVIYSMASSSLEDAPRGMDFLYNANRFNVAISRARSAAIVVASPKLFSPDCRTPSQMKMANAFCRYLEMAKIVR